MNHNDKKIEVIKEFLKETKAKYANFNAKNYMSYLEFNIIQLALLKGDTITGKETIFSKAGFDLKEKDSLLPFIDILKVFS